LNWNFPNAQSEAGYFRDSLSHPAECDTVPVARLLKGEEFRWDSTKIPASDPSLRSGQETLATAVRNGVDGRKQRQVRSELEEKQGRKMSANMPDFDTQITQ
jgi:hypothetical protein